MRRAAAAGLAMGTPAYMSPGQTAGEPGSTAGPTFTPSVASQPGGRRLNRRSGRGRCRRGPCIDESLADRIDSIIEAFQRTGAQQHEIAGLAEYDFVYR